MSGPGWIRRERWTGYDAIRVALGVLLLVAAGLKGHQLATEPILGHGILNSPWFLIGVVEFEIFFGLWLIAGLYPKWTWVAACGCFTVFAGVSLFQALSGAASCGCFGKVPVNPWYTATLDVAAIFALLLCRPTRRLAGEAFATSVSAVWTAWLVLGVPTAVLVTNSQSQHDAEVGEAYGNGVVVVADPRNWVGKPFALLDYIDIGDQLIRNEWIVLLYHHDCPRCQEAIAEYVERSAGVLAERDCQRLALVEVPPYAPSSRRSTFLSASWVVGRVSDSQQWFVQTPLTVRLREGKVVGISSGGSGVVVEQGQRNDGRS